MATRKQHATIELPAFEPPSALLCVPKFYRVKTYSTELAETQELPALAEVTNAQRDI